MKVALVILGLFAAAHCLPSEREAESDKTLSAKTDTLAEATKTSAESSASSSSGNLENETPSKEDKHPTTRGVLMVKDEGTQIVISRRNENTEAKSETKDGHVESKGELTKEDSAKPKTTRTILQETTAEGATAVSGANLDNSAGQEKGPIVQKTSAKGDDLAIASAKMVSKGETKAEEPALAPASTKSAAGGVVAPTTVHVTNTGVGDPSVSIHKP